VKLVLLHSPLVGPATWDALAPLLRARGHDVVVPDFRDVIQGDPPYYPRLAACAADATGADTSILIAHSGAGALVPAIAERCDAAGAVFVDALLPHPSRSWFETTSPSLQAHLRTLAHDGRLPPWHRWWPKGTMETLLPDAAQRECFTTGLDELPLAYFEERAPDAILATPSAYLQLSGSYAAETGQAEADGWPVARLPLSHLAMLTHASDVAAEISRLAASFD
jgi:hypothetical protein